MKLRDMLSGCAAEMVTLLALFAMGMRLPYATAFGLAAYFAGVAASRAIRRYIWYCRWLQQRRSMRIKAGAQIYKLEREER